jgi:soluble cytochrome b562
MREREHAQIVANLERKVAFMQSALADAEKRVGEEREKAVEADDKVKNITHLIDRLEADIKAKEEGRSQNVEDVEFFKKKLLEAESYISELDRENVRIS